MTAPKKQSRLHLLLIPIACSPLLLLALYPIVGSWTVFIGRFHPVVLHMPIAILALTTLMEFLQVFSFGHLKFSTRLPLFIGTITAVAAMVLGILLMSGEAMEGALIKSHLQWGIATAVAAVISLTLRAWPHYSTHPTLAFAYRTMLLVTCGIMTWASHQGASITHGETYLTAHIPWKADVPDEAEQALAHGLSLPLEERLVYDHLIVPIFNSKCYDCHQSKSFKGRLLMDTYAGLIEGGETGPAIVPGNIKDSLAMTRVYLPISHEDRMPPANEAQLSDEETRLIEWWIQQGAPIDQKITELAVDTDIEAAIESTSTTLLSELNAAPEEAHHELTVEEVIALRAPLAAAMAQLESKYPGAVRYQDSQSDAITISSYTEPWTDTQIAELAPIAAKVKELVLPHSELSAASATVINQMTELQVLDLRNGTIGDDFITALELQSLQRLNLFQTQVSAAAVPALSRQPQLQSLYLSYTAMTAEAVSELLAQIPECNIVHESVN